MVQRVEYSVLPGVTDETFLTTINKLVGHIKRTELDYRALRDWLRENGIWDKERVPIVCELLDLRFEKKTPASLGPWAEKFFESDGAEAQRALLFDRLLRENTLLIKYVLEALDMEGGGRLHSTYELHRMLSSYVYPGTPIGLTEFQAWIKWMVLSGRIKLVGIRWGLTDEGKTVVPRMRMIDVDEFLEDEADELDAADAAGAEPAQPQSAETEAKSAPTEPAKDEVALDKKSAKNAAPAKQDKKAAVAKADSAQSKDSAATSDGPAEDLPDMPPEAPPVDDEVFRQYEATLEVESEAESPGSSQTEHRPPAHRATIPPGQLVQYASVEVACPKEMLDTPEVINRLREFGRQRGLGGGSLLLAHGIENRMAESEAVRHLFLAGVLARLYAERPDGSLADLLVDRVGSVQPVAVLLDRPETLPEVIVRWGLAHPDRASMSVRTVLLDAIVGGRILKARQDMPTVLAEAATSEVLLGLLSQGVLRGAGPTAQFWLVREMVRIGLWSHDAATSISFVPNRANRLFAYRLHLLDSHFALGVPRLIEIARTLNHILPPGSVEARAFEELAPSDHLRFDCKQVEICQRPCGL